MPVTVHLRPYSQSQPEETTVEVVGAATWQVVAGTGQLDCQNEGQTAVLATFANGSWIYAEITA